MSAKKKNTKANDELPLGFGMALSQNTDAMQRFSSLSASQKNSYISQAHNVNSKKEMQALVQSITNGTGMF